ncbi:MAG: apolipoprotein N-acyltransferase [Gloeocapsa sp. DLM2.Bin57]|nr:MAG: apolipoprotein N-acyltransferase [Gloeocapsa sp. DLM2.Bin57]
MGKILLAFGGGLLMGLAPAPLDMWYLPWIGLIPLWVLLSQEKKPSLLLPLVWGVGYHGVAIFWITGIHPMTWLGVDWWSSLLIALICWLFLTAWGSALVLLWGIGFIYWLRVNFLTRLLGGVALWCALESVWSLTPLWWTTLAYTQSPTNLIILQLGQFSGTTTVTAAIVAVNGLLAEAFLYRWCPQFLIAGLSLFIMLHGWGFWLSQAPDTAVGEETLKVGIIQGNIPNEIKLFSQGWYQAIAGYTAGYQELANQGVDIVLTPETALPFEVSETFYNAIIGEGVPVWLGTFTKDEQQYFNSLLTITGTGEIYSRYDKVNLVPLGEYIPLQNIFGAWINRLSPLNAVLTPGNPNQLLDTPLGRVAVGICYDSAYGEHFRRQTSQGAIAIITAANNAHYSIAMPAQHHAQDVLRAIESDRFLARATNTGISAIIDNRGRTLWRSGINTYEISAHSLSLRHTKTLYVLWGDWLTKLLVVLAIITRVFVKFKTKF